MISKIWATKLEIATVDFIKFKTLSSSKSMKRVQRLLPEWKETFLNHVCDKGLVSKLYKELFQLS
jgi:hypothetical protein